MYFLLLSSKTESIQLPRSLWHKSPPEIRVGLNEQGSLYTCEMNKNWHLTSSTQTFTSPIKHPDIDTAHQASKHWHHPASTPRHWHCPLSTQTLPSTIKHPRHWHYPFKHPNIDNIILQAPPTWHPHLKTIFVGRYAQTSDQTQASSKQSHISSNPWTMPINLIYTNLSPPWLHLNQLFISSKVDSLLLWKRDV
jgi:hypothetical protein